ncbi:hypothetical protein VTH06DRAFT_8778 [Thermothelomyces fergusii]
MSPSDV